MKNGDISAQNGDISAQKTGLFLLKTVRFKPVSEPVAPASLSSGVFLRNVPSRIKSPRNVKNVKNVRNLPVPKVIPYVVTLSLSDRSSFSSGNHCAFGTTLRRGLSASLSRGLSAPHSLSLTEGRQKGLFSLKSS